MNKEDTFVKTHSPIKAISSASEKGTRGINRLSLPITHNVTAMNRGMKPCLTIAATQIHNNTFMPCVVLAVRNPLTGSTSFLVGLLDSGSTGLVISSSAAEKLSVKTWNEVVTIKVLEETTCSVRQNCRIDLFSLDDDKTQYLNRRAIIVDSIPVGGDSIPRQADVQRYKHMHGVKLITPPNYSVDLIISVNMAATWCLPREFRRGPDDEPIGIRSLWGWTFIGGETPSSSLIASYLIRVDKDVLGEKLDRIFNEDFKPIPGDQELDKCSREDVRALSLMNESLKLQGCRYIASAPWKYSKAQTCQIVDSIDSARTAKKRLESLGRRMDRDPEFKIKIFSQIETLESKGYIERVPISELHNKGKWYAPLHPVIKPRKPDKVRLTHDASAKSSGFALNDFLLKGPDYTCKLISVILKARIHPIFLKCDIKDFFMRVLMDKDDQDAFRFFFWSDRTKQSVIEWRTKVWLFGLLSSPCIANLALRRCASEHAENFNPEVRRAIEEST